MRVSQNKHISLRRLPLRCAGMQLFNVICLIIFVSIFHIEFYTLTNFSILKILILLILVSETIYNSH